MDRAKLAKLDLKELLVHREQMIGTIKRLEGHVRDLHAEKEKLVEERQNYAQKAEALGIFYGHLKIEASSKDNTPNKINETVVQVPEKKEESSVRRNIGKLNLNNVMKADNSSSRFESLMEDPPVVTPRTRVRIFENIKQELNIPKNTQDMVLDQAPQITPRRRNMIFGDSQDSGAKAFPISLSERKNIKTLLKIDLSSNEESQENKVVELKRGESKASTCDLSENDQMASSGLTSPMEGEIGAQGGLIEAKEDEKGILA